MIGAKTWRKLRRRYQLARGTHITQKTLSPAQRAIVKDQIQRGTPVPLVDPMPHIWKRGQTRPTGSQMESAKISFRKATGRTLTQEQAHTDLLRQAGCICPRPLLGYRPGVGPRCRLCNLVAPEDQDD